MVRSCSRNVRNCDRRDNNKIKYRPGESKKCRSPISEKRANLRDNEDQNRKQRDTNREDNKQIRDGGRKRAGKNNGYGSGERKDLERVAK